MGKFSIRIFTREENNVRAFVKIRSFSRVRLLVVPPSPSPNPLSHPPSKALHPPPFYQPSHTAIPSLFLLPLPSLTFPLMVPRPLTLSHPMSPALNPSPLFINFTTPLFAAYFPSPLPSHPYPLVKLSLSMSDPLS